MRSILGKLYQKVSNIGLLAMLVLSSISALGPIFLSQTASAAPGVTYSTVPLNSGWTPDRTTPSGGSSVVTFAGRSALQENILNSGASVAPGFNRTEGLGHALTKTSSIQADLYVNSDWSTKQVRAGLWGVGEDTTPSISSYPIVQFKSTGSQEGWQIWDSASAGGWVDVSAGYNVNAWNTLELTINKTDNTKTDVYINGNLVGTSTGDPTADFSEVILNNYNYASTDPSQDYSVDWSNIKTGYYNPAAPTGLQFKNGSTVIANGSTFNNTAITNNTDLEWLNGSSEATNAYQTQITYPDSSSSIQWTGTKNLWIGQTAYVNNYFGQKGDGVYSYQVKARSTVTGVWSDWSTPVSLSYDTHSPTAQFTVTPPQYVNGNFHVEGSANDNVKLSGVFFDVRDPSDTTGNAWRAGCVGSVTPVYANNYKDATISCDINTSSLIEGHVYTLRIHAGDYAGYGSAGESTTFIVDRTAPTTPTLSSPYDGVIMNGASVTQSWADSSSDVDHYIYESYNDAAATSLRWHQEFSTANKIATNVGNTTYWWRVKAVDHAGNVSAWSNLWKITIDNDAPIVNITAPIDGAHVTGTVVISGTVTDANPDHYYLVVKNSSNSVVGGPQTVYSSTVADFNWNTTTVSDGTYTIDLEARDAAGNKDAGSVMTINVVVDNHAPVITVTGGNLTLEAGGAYSEQGATWTDAVDGSGNVTDITGDTVDTLVPGIYTITYKKTDIAGNTGTGTRTVTVVDTTAPTVTLNGSNVTLTVGDTYSEQGATWTDIVDGSGTVTNVTGTVDINTPGAYTVTYTYTDVAGNTATATRTVTVEAAPEVLGDTTTAPSVASRTSGTSNTETTDANGEVKGDSTTATDNTGSVKAASDTNTNPTGSTNSDNGSGNIFGLAWYWWVLILAAIAGLWWFLFGRNKKGEE
jgi:hypothetical protein